MSTIIIGAGTNVTLPDGDYCVTSVNWNYNPNPQRLYCLGDWDPHRTIEKATWTVSLTLYSPGPSKAVDPSTDCENIQDYQLLIDPRGCGDVAPAPVAGSFAISGYSYSKGDPNAPGQETWNFTRWVASGNTPAPNYVIRGIVEGTATDPEDETGIVFRAGTKTQATAGSVSAGSTGRYDITNHGVVSNIGNSFSPAGSTGNGNASIPLTPLWF